MKQSGLPSSHVTKPCPREESNHRTVPVACGDDSVPFSIMPSHVVAIALPVVRDVPNERACIRAEGENKKGPAREVAGPFVHRNMSARRPAHMSCFTLPCGHTKRQDV